MQLCPTIQDIGAKNTPYLYHTISHEQGALYYTSADFVPDITSANVILTEVDIVILFWTQYYVFLLNFAENITFKATAELLCVCEQHSGV